MISNQVRTKKVYCFFILFLFISTSFFYNAESNEDYSIDETVTISGFNDSITIPPNKDYVLKFSPESLTFSKQTESLSFSLSEKVKKAIVKAPDWLESALIYQFKQLKNPSVYADIILQAEKRVTDEIAFCIAHSPLGNPPQAELILENVYQVYNVSNSLSYAEILDINMSYPNYFSTVEYKVLSGNHTVIRTLPKYIYYWYIVHPQILSESPKFIYGKFWRDYLIYHNDIGYPLLLEKMENISFLWDEESYRQPKDRDWEESIFLHPTAVEAVSYWVGKTVPFQAIGDRPGQPNLIAHQHNGWCGELQRIAVAGLRSVLIPSTSVCNIAEDHVWREFYDNGWHQNDNWWSDGGGTVDISKVYTDGWGKDMSSVFSWRGDGKVSDVTSRYLHSNETVNVSFKTTDLIGNPLDGMRVTVLVKGLKDITWYKNQFLTVFESVWNKLPSFIQESFLEEVYTQIHHTIENSSDVIDGLTISIWNYTNAEGECSFTLGNNDEYVFLVQQPFESLPFPLASWTSFRWLNNPRDTQFSIRFPKMISEKKPIFINEGNQSNSKSLEASISLTSKGVQYQANVRNNDIGIYSTKTPISCFILNKKEYNKYVNKSDFDATYYYKENIINDNILLGNQPYYFIFYNPTQNTFANINVTISINQTQNSDFIAIINPSTTNFHHPHYQVGELITINGVSSAQANISINNKTIPLSAGSWQYTLNTTSFTPNKYTLKATCKTKITEKQITLLDNIPPTINILTPTSSTIINEEKQITILGTSSDNHKIKNVFYKIDNTNWIPCKGKNTWNISIDTSILSKGVHHIFIKSIDQSDNQKTTHIPLLINDTTQSNKPIIHSIEWMPKQPNNKSSIRILTNISTNDSFPLKKATLQYKTNNYSLQSLQLYEYANNPIQTRHSEDPKINITNQPVYGRDLGKFQTNTTLSFRIITVDIANNKEISEWKTIQIN